MRPQREIRREAFWHAHNKKCAYCGERVRFLDLEIDHIVPLRLEWVPSELAALKTRLLLADDFDLSSALNMIPAHSSCNSKKGGSVLTDEYLKWQLEMARQKLSAVEQELARLNRTENADRVLAMVGRAYETGILTSDEVLGHLLAIDERQWTPENNPAVICFSVNLLEEDEPIQDMIGNKSLGPEIYDDLEEDLIRRVEAVAKGPFTVTEEARNGETLSVRIACWFDNIEEVVAAVWPYWECLEKVSFVSLYGRQATDYFSKSTSSSKGV